MGRTLVAGIGNVFLGDDGFGVEVAARLVREPLRDGVRVVDTGIRARDLAYELLDGGYDMAILIDTVSRGDAPGTVFLIEPPALNETSPDGKLAIDGHAMSPNTILSFLSALGGVSTRIWIVGCEPACVEEGIGLSAPVTGAVDQAVNLVRELLDSGDRAPYHLGDTSIQRDDTCV